MKVKNVIIKSFRNLKNVSYSLEGNNVAFIGNNRTGKTNTINAIMWCLTGVDLKNGSQDIKNVPFDLVDSEGVVVDVSVLLDDFNVRRTITLKNKSCKQTIYIDGLEYEKVSDAELEIDKRLGILPYAIFNTKSFNVRRLFISPLYLTCVKESDFREFITKFVYSKHDIIKQVLCEMPELVRKNLDDLVELTHSDLDKIAFITGKDLKAAKKLLDELTIYEKYSNIYKTTLTDEFKEAKNNAFNNLVKAKELESATDYLVNGCEKKMNELPLFDNVEIKLFEKGQGEDVYKNVCYVVDKTNNDSTLAYGSTSEKILLCLKFVNDFFKGKELITLLDEFETVDKTSKKQVLDAYPTEQFIVAKVVDNIELENVCKSIL